MHLEDFDIVVALAIPNTKFQMSDDVKVHKNLLKIFLKTGSIIIDMLL